MPSTIRATPGSVRAVYASVARAMRAADQLAAERGVRVRLVRFSGKAVELDGIARRDLMVRTSRQAILGAAAGTAAALVAATIGGLNIRPDEVALVAMLGSAIAGIQSLCAAQLEAEQGRVDEPCCVVAWADEGSVPETARAILRSEGPVELADL